MGFICKGLGGFGRVGRLVAYGGRIPQLSTQLLFAAAGEEVAGVAVPFFAEVLAGPGTKLGLDATPGGGEVDAGDGDGVPGGGGAAEELSVAFGRLNKGAGSGVAVEVGGFGSFEEGGVLEVGERARCGDEEIACAGFGFGASAHGEADDDAVFGFGGFVDEDAAAEVFLGDAEVAGHGADGLGAGLRADSVEGADGGSVDDLRGITPHLAAKGVELGLYVDFNGHGGHLR